MMMQMVEVVVRLLEDISLLSLALCTRRVVLVCFCMRATPPNFVGRLRIFLLILNEKKESLMHSCCTICGSHEG